MIERNHSKVEVTLSQSLTHSDAVEIEHIEALVHKQGHGSAVMRELCELADKLGVTLTLGVANETDEDYETSDEHQLITWYEGFGFATEHSMWGERIYMVRTPDDILTEGTISLTPDHREAILADPRVRRGTKIGINTPLWRGQDGDEGSGGAEFGAGLYFTADKSYAKKYGKVSEVSRTNLPDNPLRFDSLNDFQIWRGYVYKILDCDGRDFAAHYYDFGDFIRDLDPTFDGMQIYSGRDAVFVLYPEVVSEGVGTKCPAHLNFDKNSST